MRAVRSSGTTPELAVRKCAHGMGYRYRLHGAGLPGRPDLVFPSRRVAVFVHGCFWHQHPGCARAARPGTRRAYWDRKLDRNVARDREVQGQLAKMGWRVVVLWECGVGRLSDLESTLQEALGPRA